MFYKRNSTWLKLSCCLASTLALVVFLGTAHIAYSSQQIAQKDKSRVEVVFVLDTTGSMSSLIDGAKKKIWAIANGIVDQNPDADIYVGLVGYRDIGDEYVTKYFPLTTDIQQIYGELLTFRADGGGDTPESVNEALDVAVTRLGWSDPKTTKASRIIFLVGDAPPHMDYKQDRKYQEVVSEAVQRGIIVNAVQCGDMLSTTEIWKEIASLGKGEYMHLPQDGGRIIVIETPYDITIRKIQILINQTVIPYGSIQQQRDVRGKAKLFESAPAPASADMASFVNKSSKGERAVTGHGDLVVDSNGNSELLKSLKSEELPEDLQGMSEEERGLHLATLYFERKELTRQLAEQVKLRDEYIHNATAKSVSGKGGESLTDSFDTSVSKALKKQIR